MFVKAISCPSNVKSLIVFIFLGEEHYVVLLWVYHQPFSLTPTVCHLQGMLHQIPERCKKASTSHYGYIIGVAIDVKAFSLQIL